MSRTARQNEPRGKGKNQARSRPGRKPTIDEIAEETEMSAQEVEDLLAQSEQGARRPWRFAADQADVPANRVSLALRSIWPYVFRELRVN